MLRRLAAFAVLVAAAGSFAAPPVVPCDGRAPTYPAAAAEPRITVVHGDELKDWAPPGCTGWSAGPLAYVIATAARFVHRGDGPSLLVRFGAISEYTAIRYWSVAASDWRAFALEASALADADPGHRRADFAQAEFATGTARYFWQRMPTELAFPGTVALVFRVEIRELGPDHVVVSVASEPATVALFWRLRRGDIRMLYFFDREAGDVWRYFTLTSVSGVAALSPEWFFRNSARGIFRHSAGLPAEVAEQP